MKRIATILLPLLLSGLFLWFTNWRFRDRLSEWLYDWRHPENKPVYDRARIRRILSELPTLRYDQLDRDYLQRTDSDLPEYRKMLQEVTYYRISREDLQRFIAADFRIKRFVCKDEDFKDCILGRRPDVTTILNEKLLFKTLELMDSLYARGYNETGFEIVNGHRHPRYNRRIGGAKLSRHIRGEAADISIYDINDDGLRNRRDKEIVLDLLEHAVIKDEGGVGLYPGTQHVHYDVRGYKARWDSFKPGR